MEIEVIEVGDIIQSPENEYWRIDEIQDNSVFPYILATPLDRLRETWAIAIGSLKNWKKRSDTCDI